MAVTEAETEVKFIQHAAESPSTCRVYCRYLLMGHCIVLRSRDVCKTY